MPDVAVSDVAIADLSCPLCGSDLFEQPPCPDGHGPDCLDLACTSCGSALSLGALQTPRTPRPEWQAA